MSKKEYLAELSKPGSLERIDALPESPFLNSSKKQNHNFSEIRNYSK